MRKYDWLEDRIDIIGVKLYSFREHNHHNHKGGYSFTFLLFHEMTSPDSVN